MLSVCIYWALLSLPLCESLGTRLATYLHRKAAQIHRVQFINFSLSLFIVTDTTMYNLDTGQKCQGPSNVLVMSYTTGVYCVCMCINFQKILGKLSCIDISMPDSFIYVQLPVAGSYIHENVVNYLFIILRFISSWPETTHSTGIMVMCSLLGYSAGISICVC